MPIGYNVRANSLTSPPSYRCEAVAASIVDETGIANLVNVYNPSITAATAATVMSALRAVVKQELLAGRSVKIGNFISFVNTLPAKLALPTDPLPDGVLNISAKISKTLKDEMRQEATFTRIGYPVKAPTIISTWDTNTDINGWIRPNFAYKIAGQYIGFDPTDSTQGVYLRQIANNGTSSDIKQTNIASNSPSEIIIVPSYTETSYNDMRIIVKTRYTQNGELREGIAKTRGLLVVNDLFRVGTNPVNVSYSDYTGVPTEATVKFVAEYSNENKVLFSVGYLSGTMGPKVEITAEGDYDLNGLGTAITVSVLAGKFDDLVKQLIEEGRYIQDVATLSVA